MRLTEEQVSRAFEFHANGVKYKDMAKEFSCSMATVHKALKGKVPPRASMKHAPRSPKTGNDEVPAVIPESVRVQWLERARAYASRTDLTAWLMGDPIPGWSALERR